MSRGYGAAVTLQHVTSVGRIFDHYMPMGQFERETLDFSRRQHRRHLRRSPYYRWISRRMELAERLTRWMSHIPFVGPVVAVYWFSVIDDGTPLPYDALAFSFLNDWFRPTLWHTWYSMTHGSNAPLSGIYPQGAPRNRVEAESAA